tara:strand:- start:383 stop:1489 length:1107 start_codon:yes stop_codon:yes gene_type:complete
MKIIKFIKNNKKIILLLFLCIVLGIILGYAYYNIQMDTFIPNNKITTPQPIDLVIPWSGENNPGDKEYSSLANRDEGILKYSIRSIIKHAPWIRTIYIFKDPPNNYPSWLDKEKVSHKIKIIDRCPYFKNKDWCPSMNASAIEANIYKINGLSDNYLTIEDDTLLMNDIHYTDFFTKDMKKLKSNCHFPLKDIYNPEKVKKGSIKPPKSPKMFSGGDSHVMIAQKKELYAELYKKYPEWFDFVSSHKKRWCCCDDTCPDPDDDCKSCYDELNIYMRVPHYEAYLQDKYEYRDEIPSMGTDNHYNFVENLIKIQNKEKTVTFYNINNIYTQNDYQRKKPEEFEKKKLKLHNKLEEMFPEKEFYINIYNL